MKIRHNLSFLFLFFSLIAVSPLFAAEEPPDTVTVEGYAMIEGRNRSAARENALNNAFRRATEQVVGVMIDSKTVVKNSELIQDRIFSKSAGFIKTYRIISEKFEPDACRMTVRATVSAIRLEKSLNDVGLLSKKMGKPRVAIIMTEQNVGNDSAAGSPADSGINAGIAETLLNSIFARKGYNLVEKETLLAIARRSGAASSSGSFNSTEAAVHAAADGGAEVVILGQAVAKAGNAPLSGSNMRSSYATVSARIVDADTAQLLGSSSINSQSVHVNPTAGGAEAIRKATEQIAENLNRQIIAKWEKRSGGTRTVRIVIKNIQFDKIAKVRELMAERLRHLDETVERGYRDNTLNLDAEIAGTARELADEIVSTNFDGFPLRVLSFTANTVTLQLHRK